MISRARALSVLLAPLVMVAAAAAWVPEAATSPAAFLYRIFLTDGSTLVSYGDFARVADRVVFSIPVGAVARAGRRSCISSTSPSRSSTGRGRIATRSRFAPGTTPRRRVNRTSTS